MIYYDYYYDILVLTQVAYLLYDKMSEMEGGRMDLSFPSWTFLGPNWSLEKTGLEEQIRIRKYWDMVESPMKWGIIRIHFQVTLGADERFKQNSPKKELPVNYFCEHNFFQKVEGNNLQISSGQKKCWEILQYPFFSFSSTTFPQHGHSTI